MSSFSYVSDKKRSRTCETSGHHCGLESLLYLNIITKEQYDYLMNLPGFCEPDIGTKPSNILKLLNGEIISSIKNQDADG